MRISDLYKSKKTVVSLEIFPPKKDGDVEIVYEAIRGMSKLRPDYISVTFGAGGKTSGTSVTTDVVRHIEDTYGINALAHLTCSGIGKHNVSDIMDSLEKKAIQNVLALRGDEITAGGFEYAKELIAALSERGFCIGAAAYPEGHISCDSLSDDIAHMKQKEESGADFFVTQLFFENDIFYKFLDKARKAGIGAPISAGIMPILSRSQIERMIFMCGASLPSKIIKIINKYGESGESLMKAGVEYSLTQMQDLCDNGVQGIHIYTMNKPYIAEFCMSGLKRLA